MQKSIKVIVLLLALATVGTEALQCLTCDSLTDPRCGFSHNEVVSVPVVQCGGGVTQCYTTNLSEDRTVRGCYDSFPCGATGCDMCFSDNCNDQQSITETCTSCVTNPLNNLCEWNVAATNTPIICPHTTWERSGCYLRIQDNVYTRDCVANLSDELFEECKAGEVCKICTGANCNSKDEFQRCYTCDSEIDENCVYRPDGYYIKTCPNYDDTCIAFAVANGKTGRGCSSDIDTGSTYCPSTNCIQCSSVDCNSQLVPADRIHCYQCSADQFGCTHGQEMFQSYRRACKNFNFQDQCYIFQDGDDFHRGCMSDNSAQSQACAQSPEKCEVCSTNDCNVKALVKDATLSCHQCSGDACFLETGIPVVKCTAEVQTEDEETCYYSTLVGGAIQMGCTLDDTPACSNNNCHKCSGDHCNAEYAPKKSQLLCHQCLDTDENCPWRQKQEDAVACQSPVLYGQVDSCYHYKYSNGDVRRGCLKDEAGFCYAHDCQTCTGNYCNSVAETQSCIQCTSTQEMYATCGGNASALNAMPCAQEAFLEERGCFSFKGDDDVVIRGCWNEATEEHKTICAAEGDERCNVCIGHGCNTADHSGSGQLLVALPLVLLSGLISWLVQ